MEQLVAQLSGVFGIIIIFGAIVTFHEFGHFIVAKLSGMGVHEFSIGFGPALFKWTRHNTLYAIRLIPLGGYVRIAGMEPGDEQAENGFDKKPFLARFATIFAGAAMNLVLALLVMIVLGLAIGYSVPDRHAVATMVMKGSPAAKAGIREGDVLVRINGVANPNTEEAIDLIRNAPSPIPIEVLRHGNRIAFSITPNKVDEIEWQGLRLRIVKAQKIGVALPNSLERVGPGRVVVLGVQKVYERSALVLASLVSMIAGDIPANQVSGPVGVMRVSYEASSGALQSATGMATFLDLFAFLSINIGLFNMLPLPALDGGRLLILTVERIIGKPFNREKEAMVHTVGLVLLLGLILLVTVKDIWSWIGGK